MMRSSFGLYNFCTVFASLYFWWLIIALIMEGWKKNVSLVAYVHLYYYTRGDLYCSNYGGIELVILT